MEPIKQVTFERIFDAPQETVWQAWINPEQLKVWWGPNEVTIPECSIDLRVGGSFYIVMEAGAGMGDLKGTRWPMRATFTEVDAPAKLVYDATAWTEGQEDTTQIDQTQELTLSEENGKTKLTLVATLHKLGVNASGAAEGMQYGYNQQLDKLTAYLQK